MTVFDLALYLLEKQGPLKRPILMMQLYYAVAWTAAFEKRLLFQDPFRVGTLHPSVDFLLIGMNAKDFGGPSVLTSEMLLGNSSTVSPTDRLILDLIVEHYGDWTLPQLGQCYRTEAPWHAAKAVGREVFDSNRLLLWYSKIPPRHGT